MPEISFKRQSLVKSGFDLTPIQQQVSNLPLGQNALILGSPGSGKTVALAALATNLIRANQPDQVLVLAANRYAADKLRDFLAVELQLAVPSSLARTLPSFAFGVLNKLALDQSRELPLLLTGAEQQAIISNLIAELDIEWPAVASKTVRSLNGFAAEVRELLTICLENQVNPEKLVYLANQQQKPLWQSAAQVLAAYLESLPNNVYDSAQLLSSAQQAMIEHPYLVAEVKQVLVDDSQELSPAAVDFLETLAATAGLILFSDPDSSTLGFRATEQKVLMQKLRSRFADFSEFRLEQPLRQPSISAAMAAVSARIDPALAGTQRKGLTAQNLDDDSVEVQIFHDQQTQYAAIAAKIRHAHLIEKIPFEQMAIVARSRTILDQVQSLVSYFEVPVFQAGSAKAFIQQFAARSLLELAQASISFDQLDQFQRAALFQNAFCSLDSLQIRRLTRELRKWSEPSQVRITNSELLANLFDDAQMLHQCRGTEAKIAANFLERFAQAQSLASEPGSVEQLLWALYEGSITVQNWLAEENPSAQITENLNSLVALFAAANRFVERNPELPASHFVLEQLSKNIAEDSLESANELPGQVPLLTPAMLIGRRFRRIFVPDLIEGIWPNLKPRSSLFDAQQLSLILSGSNVEQGFVRSELPDETRLLFKTLGAASEKIVFTFAQTEDEQPSQFFRFMCSELPEATKFEIDSLNLRSTVGRLRRQIALASPDQVLPLAVKLAKLASAAAPGAHPSQWYGLAPLSSLEPLSDLNSEIVSISPSQLENFAKCPLHWFLSANGGDVKDFKSSLGTILHQLFEQEVAMTSAVEAEAQYWQMLQSRWSELRFDGDWIEQQTSRKARRALFNMLEYLQKFEVQSASVIGREVEFEFDIGKARLRGKVDRIELRPDGSIRIVDLKTSSRVPADREVRQNPQLGSYQLAFEAGAFDQLEGVTKHQDFDASIVAIGGEKLAERVQPSIKSDVALRQELQNLIERATNEMAMTNLTLEARMSTHCTNDREFGSCRIHLVKAVSAVD